MFTHLNTLSGSTFTTGETITGSTSGATGTLESISTTTSVAVSSISVADPGVVTTGSNHNLRDGQQVKFTSPSFSVDSVAVTTNDIFTVRNSNGTNTFELYDQSRRNNYSRCNSIYKCNSCAHTVLLYCQV